MPNLPDGRYDAVVIEAEGAGDADFRLELTISLGPHIGRVIALHGHHVDTNRRPAARDLEPIDFLGIAGVLTVRNGVPTFRPEVA